MVKHCAIVNPWRLKKGYVPGWRLMCNMRAIPILEPGMGNIIPLSALAADQPVDEKEAISNSRDTMCPWNLLSCHET